MPLIRALTRTTAVMSMVAIAACSQHAGGQSAGRNAERGPIRVVTTISVLESFVRGVAGNRATVTSIVPIGASPETYEPTPQDVATVAGANVLVENGAGLESWLDRLLHDAAGNAHVVVCADGLPVKNANPHLWMDPELAKQYVLKIRNALIETDPADEAFYRNNASRYNQKLDALRVHIAQRIETIPPERRYMIVFHNAWQYYNDRFGITTLGFVERNPGQEPNPQQIAQLVDLAKRHGVRAVFSEPEYSPKLLYAIAQGAGVRVVESLYDDSLGTKASVADYIAMLNYDTGVIVRALR